MPSIGFALQLSIRMVNQNAIRVSKHIYCGGSGGTRLKVPLTLLHRNLNYVMECGVTNLFCNIERAIEGGLCMVNIPREGTPSSIGLHWSIVCFY